MKHKMKRVMGWATRLKCFDCIIIVICMVALFIYSSKFYNAENVSSKIPTLLWWTPEFPSHEIELSCPNYTYCNVLSDKNKARHSEIDAYLFYGSGMNLKNLPMPRNVDKHIWGLFHEESPRNVPELMHPPFLQLFNYSATFSRHSDVPLTLQYLKTIEDITSNEYFISTKEKNSLLSSIAPILFLQSDCDTATERELYVEELMKHIAVDSYGTCLNNRELPHQFQEDYLNKLDDSDFLKFIARYKFVIAIENGVCEDYITEKLWRALKVGTVPIYFGSPSVTDWLPNNKSVILLTEYPTPTLMASHVRNLLASDRKYEEYLEHKLKKIITNKRLILESETYPYQSDTLMAVNEFECLICQIVHERRKGVQKQSIVSKKHYDCPKPMSALTLSANDRNSWIYTWEVALNTAESIYQKVMNTRY